MDYVRNNRMLSLLGQRGTLGTVLCDLAKENTDIVAISADLLNTSGLQRFLDEYPERCINAGIAEQNAIGVAAGLADAGKIPFVTTFSNFATMRANEFVRHFMAYMNCNVKLVGLGSGFAMEFFGTTHYGLEDIALLRSYPNITILSPADCLELTKCIEYSAAHDGPVYIRLSGQMNNPIVYREDYDFEVGKGIVLREGSDAVVFATGSMVTVALKAAKKLEKDSIYIKVINIHTIKPIDLEIVKNNLCFLTIITIEEHSAIGGLGSAVAEIMSEEKSSGKLYRLGTEDVYKPAGSYKYMLEQHGLTSENIIRIVKENINE